MKSKPTNSAQHQALQASQAIGITPAPRLIRTAAYIRVSTALDIQENSFDVQEKYFTEYIRSNPEWRMVGIYSDYALTGTSKEKRPGFQRLMRHCEEGKIDRVICKSLSRFARNTLDTLDAVRKLKDLGISVYFEKENLDSMSIQSEFILSTIAAIAQEESRTISENLRLAYKQRSEKGLVSMFRIFGYRVNRPTKHGKQTVTVDKAEAETVRYIYAEYLKGRKLNAIADDLIIQGKPNVNGMPVWTGSMVRAILVSEKYVGDVRTQKNYIADYLTHKSIKNRGERAQHIIENHHEAIVDREIWNEVQLFLYNPESWDRTTVAYPFTSRLHCPCGANYQRSHGQSRFKWQCGKSKRSRLLCTTEGVFEDEIVYSLREVFLEKFGTSGTGEAGNQLDIKKLLIGLKTVQDFDNVESQRLVLKRRIAAATGEEKEKLAGLLDSQEHLWTLLEADRQFRANAIDWLKGMEDRRATSQMLLTGLDAGLLRAWFVEGTIDGDTLTCLWLDGTTTESTITRTGKRKPSHHNNRNTSKGDF